MSDALICPDCGGIVGAHPAPGVKACRCFVTPASSPRVVDEDAPDTVDITESERPEKICYVCGQNVAKKKRYKDKDGYICITCSKAQEELDRELVSCSECGKRIKPAGLINYRGHLICKRCDLDHKEMDKVKVDKVRLIHHDASEKKSLKNLLIVAGVLAIILILSRLRIIGG